MVLRRINNLFLILIILCSTGFYELSILGPFQKIAEFAGIGLILALLFIHIVYSEQKTIPHNFTIPIVLIFISLITSTLMAKYSRDQNIGDTLTAQSAMYYYIFYFLLHQLKIRPKDLEVIFVVFGILYVVIYLIQFLVFPKLIVDAYVRLDRGTIRIYMSGSAYLSVAYILSVQSFFRTNKIKFLLLLFTFLSIIVLSGGRQTLAIMILVLILFLVFDKKVKSRLLLFLLGIVGSIMIYLLFQSIFDALIFQSHSDASMGQDYIRLKATIFFLTDFFKNTFSYLTGNGMFANDSSYGIEISRYQLQNQFFLGDIGIIGNFAIYGSFFLLGVIMIFIRVYRLKIESHFIYIKFMFIVIFLSILTGGAFAQGHFICFIVCILYLFDVSNYSFNHNFNNSSN